MTPNSTIFAVYFDEANQKFMTSCPRRMYEAQEIYPDPVFFNTQDEAIDAMDYMNDDLHNNWSDYLGS